MQQAVAYVADRGDVDWGSPPPFSRVAALKSSRRRAVFGWSALLALFLILAQMSTFSLPRPVAGFDEVAHLDYAIQLGKGNLPTWDTVYSDELRRIGYCAGTLWTPSNDCSEQVGSLDSIFPSNHSYEAQHPPIGYLPAAMAWAMGVERVDDPVSQLALMRASNLFWAFAFILLVALLVSLLTRHLWVALAAVVFTATNPQLVGSLSYLTNDAAAPAIGCLLAISAVVAYRTKAPVRLMSPVVILVVSVGLLSGLTKLTFAVVPLSFLIFAVLARRRNLAVLSATQIIALVGVNLAYSSILAARSRLSASEVWAELLGFSAGMPFTPLEVVNSAAGTVGIFLDEDLIWGPVRPTPTAYLALGLVSGAFFVLSLVRDRGTESLVPDQALIGRATVVAAIVSAVGWTLYMYSLGGYVWEFPPRYLIPLVPVMGIAAMGAFRAYRKVLWVYVASGVVVAVFFSGPLGSRSANFSRLLEYVA